MIELALAQHQATREVDVNDLRRIRDGQMHDTRQRPLGRAITGLLQQFPLAACQRIFAGIEFSGGELDHHMAHGIAELALQHDAPVVQQRHHHHSARMHHILARCVTTVRHANSVALDLQEVALEEGFAADQVFGQMSVVWHIGLANAQ